MCELTQAMSLKNDNENQCEFIINIFYTRTVLAFTCYFLLVLCFALIISPDTKIKLKTIICSNTKHTTSLNIRNKVHLLYTCAHGVHMADLTLLTSKKKRNFPTYKWTSKQTKTLLPLACTLYMFCYSVFITHGDHFSSELQWGVCSFNCVNFVKIIQPVSCRSTTKKVQHKQLHCFQLFFPRKYIQPYVN